MDKRQDRLESPLVDLGEIAYKVTSPSLFRPEICVHISYTNYGGVVCEGDGGGSE